MTIMSKAELTDRVQDFERFLDSWSEGLRHSKRLALEVTPGLIYKVTRCHQHIVTESLSKETLPNRLFYGILFELHATEFMGPYAEKSYTVSFGFKVLGYPEMCTNKSEETMRTEGCFIKSMEPVSFSDLYLCLTAPDLCTKTFGALKKFYTEDDRQKQLKQILKWYCTQYDDAWSKVYLLAEGYKYIDVSLGPLLMADAPDLAKLILNKGV
jgi:hypothetical protein